MSEIYEHVRRIAQILNARQPNQAELKQRENAMKKCVPNLDPVALIVTFRDTVVELVLSLQLVERAAKSKHFAAQWDQPLWRLMTEMLASTEINPVIRRHAISIATVLCVKRFRPGSLITFLKNSGLSDADTLDVLRETTSVTPLTDDERHLISSWADELWPLILTTKNIELIEKWVCFVPGETLGNSGFLSNISIRNVHHFEEVLLACCDKQELVQGITSVCSQLLATGQFDFATRLFGQLKAPMSEFTWSVIASIKEILVSDRVVNMHTRLRMIENTLGFFEQKHFLLDMPLYETLVILSAVPPEVENKFWINPADTDLDDEMSNLGLYNRFMEIRQEVRHILRSFSFASEDMHGNVLSLVLNSMSSSDWRLTESVLHAFSAQQKRFAEKGGKLLTHLFSIPDPANSLHRAVSNGIIICGTTYFASIPETQLECVMQFVISCLRAIDTVDESGWLPFRAKQDNSCVVLLLNLAGSRHKLNFNLFLETFIPAIDEIKQRLYYRDPFRQSRDLFVKAVADIIMRHAADPASVLLTMFVKVCDDCRDVSLFVNQTTTSLKHLLLQAIEPKLQTFLQRNSDGVESIIARYSDCLSRDQILGCLELSSKSTDFAPNRWIAEADTIASVHGGQFVVDFSNLMNNQPVKLFPPKWFTYCLPLVGIDTHQEQEFHIAWISRITNSSIEADSFQAALTYCATSIVKISQPEILMQLGVLLTRRTIKEVSSINSNECIMILVCFGKIIGWTSLHAVLLNTVPRSPTDAKLLVDALSHNEYGKARRIMKKMIIDI
jgi:hypothetical protein